MSANRRTTLPLVIASALVATTFLIAGEPATAIGDSNQAEVALPEIDDPISPAEMEDLSTIADQKGMSLQDAIDRYAWNDNFALTVAKIREVSPDAFAGAEIVDSHNAWIAFTREPPKSALGIIDTFTLSHGGVSVEIRTDLGFTEVELQNAIELVHFALLDTPEVRDATTSYDFATGRITTIVAIEPTDSDTLVDSLHEVAIGELAEGELADILNSISVGVIRSDTPVLGGTESNTEHLGGEALSQCTSGFGTKTSTGIRGIATAGHCGNSLSDDGASLTYKAGYEGNHGDFQWHTGPQAERDDFYSGNSTTLEVNRRDVSSVGSPVVDQPLCRNGKTSKKDCQDVRKVNVCYSIYCNLVQMDAHLSADGDSGGPVFYNYTAYGIHQGWHYDIFPFDREVFSRADRIDNALNLFIATS